MKISPLITLALKNGLLITGRLCGFEADVVKIGPCDMPEQTDPAMTFSFSRESVVRWFLV